MSRKLGFVFLLFMSRRLPLELLLLGRSELREMFEFAFSFEKHASTSNLFPFNLVSFGLEAAAGFGESEDLRFT